MHKGAEGIEKLAEASLKRTKIAEEMLQIDKQQSMIALFSMPGTESSVQRRFIELSQMKALENLEGELMGNGRRSQLAPVIADFDHDPVYSGGGVPVSSDPENVREQVDDGRPAHSGTLSSILNID